jgi:hypothetical protein
MRNTVVHLHIHQDICINKIACSQISGVLKDPKSKIKFDWFNGVDSEWVDLYLKVLRSNLVQSVDYAQAKSEVEGHVIKRGIFVLDGQPIAILIASRRFKGVWRINRGPLFLCEITPDHQIQIMNLISCAFNGCLLSIAPNLAAGGHNWLAMAELGFRQRKCLPWTTVWLDLTKSEDAIRRGLSGKWRNRLNFAERSAMRMTVDDSKEAVNWMCTKHEGAMVEKGFSGVPTSILRQLNKRGMLNVYRVESDNKIVAGICIARHGFSATYLVGWLNTEGRKISANHFLLWNALMEERSKGVREFDMGGIDEYGQPSISDFKLGVGGERIQLLGEYYKF